MMQNQCRIFEEKKYQGDSGGALMVGGVLAGIVSRGGAGSCAKVRYLKGACPFCSGQEFQFCSGRGV